MESFILRFTTCNAGWGIGADCGKCYVDYGEELLYASPLDRWILPLNNTKSYSLVESGTNIDLGVISSVNPASPSNWKARFSNISSTTYIRIAHACDGVVDCTVALLRSDFPSDAAFLQQVAINMVTFLNYYYVITSEVATGIIEMEAAWYDFPCLCTAIVTLNDLTNADTSCGGCDITGEDCCLEAAIITPASRCTNAEYLNLVNIQFTDACVEVLQNPCCITNQQYITLAFPSNIVGDYYISDNLGNCSQTIRVEKQCSVLYPIIVARNNCEDSIRMRLPIEFVRPTLKGDRRMTRATNLTIKKLYQQTEASWEFRTSPLEYDTHKDIYTLLSKQIVEIQRTWDQRGTSSKNLIMDEDYKFDQADQTPAYNLYTGGGTMLEVNITQEVVNS